MQSQLGSSKLTIFFQGVVNWWKTEKEKPHSMVMRSISITLKTLFVVYFFVCLFILSLRYVVLPQVPQYKTSIEKTISQKLSNPVTISEIEASWYGFNPLLKIKDVTIHDKDGKPALQLPFVRAEISWRTLFVFDLRLSLLEINQAEIDIHRDSDGHIFVGGILVERNPDQKTKNNDWLFKQELIAISDATIRWKDDLRNAPEIALSKINFILGNSGNHHKLRFLAKTDLLTDGDLDVSADFVHPVFSSNISDISKWEGTAYLSLPTTNVDVWRPYIDLPNKIKKGTGAVNVWVTFDEGHIASLTGDINLKDVQLQIKPHLPILDVVQLSGRIETTDLLATKDGENLTLSDRIHKVQLKDMNLVTKDGIKIESFDFYENYIPESNGTPAKMEIAVDDLNLEVLAKLMNYLPLNQGIRQLLVDLAPKGTLNKFSVNLEGDLSDPSAYQVTGDFNNVSIKAVPENKIISQDDEDHTFTLPALLGIQNLTGHLSFNKTSGSIELKSPKTNFKVPTFFPKTDWNFETLNLKASWTILNENINVTIQNFAFLLDGIDGTLSGSYSKTPQDTVGVVDLTASIKNAGVDKVRNFVPIDTPKALRDWLTLAFESGHAQNVTARLKGNLTEFPFTKEGSQGEFLVDVKLKDVRLNYAPMDKNAKYIWQPIDKINGWVRFNGPKISIHADTAEINGAPLNNVDVIIPDMLSSDVYLDINGSAKGELQRFIQFVNASPVDAIIGGLTQDAITSGDADLLLKMKLPLRELEKSVVEGTLQLNNNDIILFEDLPIIKTVTGKVHFSDHGFQLEGLSGAFLGGKTSVTGGTKDKGFEVKATGDLTADGLRTNYVTGSLSRLMRLLSGSLSYNVFVIKKDTSKSGYPVVKIESNTKGFGINLPAPLGKKTSEVRHLQVEVNPLTPIAGSAHDEIKINYGIANAQYERRKQNKNWTILKGGIGINTKPVLYPNVSAYAKIDRVDLDEWIETIRTLLADAPNGKATSKEAAGAAAYVEPGQIYFQSNLLKTSDFQLSQATIVGGQQSGSWQTDVNSKELKGQFTWIPPAEKYPAGKLIAHIDSLEISRKDSGKIGEAIGPGKLQQIPEIDFTINHLKWGDIDLGRVELDTKVVRDKFMQEWHIKNLNIENADSSLKSNGIWVTNKETQRTQLTYVLDIKDGGGLLNRLGYKGILKAAPGTLKGNIGWAGLPYSLDIPSLSGNIEIDIGRGQFLKVDPGIAKLLAVLNLQSIPRRLTLDFRDMFSKGFAFDEIKAKVEMVKGLAKTDNLTMKGVQATVLMDGTVNMVKETQNLHVAVLPEINAGMASIAYSVINPAIGVGTLLAQLLLKEPLAQAFTFEYNVAGSWTEPTVTKIERKKTSSKEQEHSEIHD